MFKFKFLPICRAHSMAVPHPAAFPSAKYTVSPPIFHPTSGYRPGKKKRTCFDAITIFIYRLFMEPSQTMISIACVASVSVQFRSKERGTRVKVRPKNGASVRVRLSFDFSRGQNRNSRSSVFLCSETKQIRLLRRLWFLPRSGQWHVISMVFLHSFLRSHFAGKEVVTSRSVDFYSD